MNILIVGNGFDLSHYLPTKYDHFMVAMDAIENWDEAKGDLGFDDLFGSLYEKEDYFFGYTKAMYKTDEIKISVDHVKGLQELLKENVWYLYFSDHVREVKTWIDFELKINEVLKVLAIFILKIERISNEQGLSSNEIFFKTDVPLGQIFLTIENCHILELLKITKSGYYAEREFFEESENYYQMVEVDSDDGDANFKFYIASENVQFQHGSYKVKIDKIMLNLQKELENFVEIFNKYLELIITCLEPRRQFKTPLDYLTNLNKILSFNYTNTYNRLYGNVDVEYLHGSHGEKQNIVLGVSDLEDESLKKIKAYGFTKYLQKLLKQTDYLFLDDSTEIFKSIKRGVTMIDNELTFFNFYIWGHSLDSSDQEYIHELFSFNLEKDQYVRVIILYFSQQANFDLLANLIHILGKVKVEKWMKKGWLKFEKNPDIAKINNIKPVALPKISSS